MYLERAVIAYFKHVSDVKGQHALRTANPVLLSVHCKRGVEAVAEREEERVERQTKLPIPDCVLSSTLKQ